LAGPLLAMYEGSIWMAKFFGKKGKTPSPDVPQED